MEESTEYVLDILLDSESSRHMFYCIPSFYKQLT